MIHAKFGVNWMQGSMSTKLGKMHVHVVTPNVHFNFKKSYQFENRREMNEINTNAKLKESRYHI
jgi:hypothetical protein